MQKNGLIRGLCVSRPPALTLAPSPGLGPQFGFTDPDPQFAFTGPGPQFVFTGPGPHPRFVFTSPGQDFITTATATNTVYY